MAGGAWVRLPWLRVRVRRRQSLLVAVLCITVFTVIFIVHMEEAVHRGRRTRRVNNVYETSAAPTHVTHTTREEIHIGVVCLGSMGARDVVDLLKSVLFYHQGALHVHLVVDSGTNHTLQTLFSTWNLPSICFSFYQYFVTQEALELQEVKLRLRLGSMIHTAVHNVHKVIIVDVRMRFLTDISYLWEEFGRFSPRQVIGATFQRTQQEGDVRERLSTAVLLIKAEPSRRLLEELNRSITRKAFIWGEVARFVVRHGPQLYRLCAAWSVDVRQDLPHNQTPQAVLWTESASAPTLTREGMVVKLLSELNGYLLSVPRVTQRSARTASGTHSLRDTSGTQYPASSLALGEEAGPPGLSAAAGEVSGVPAEGSVCEGLTEQLRAGFRTHVNYHGSAPSTPDQHKVTLITQLSACRLGALVRLLTLWDGPVSVSVYVTDEEVTGLRRVLEEEPAFRNHDGLSWHLVYKRHGLYPINYLRNVALGEVRTQFVLHVDVDLVAPPNTYRRLTQHLATSPLSTNMVWVLPALGSNRPLLTNFPSNKEEAVRLMDQGVLYGYGSQGWRLGHVTTNFTYWKTADALFEVTYSINFEPYVAMATADMPRFDERFPDRMRDKISHVYELAARGFRFMVLHNLFLVHLPHTSSRTSRYFDQHHTKLEICSKKLFSDFVEDINRKYKSNGL